MPKMYKVLQVAQDGTLQSAAVRNKYALQYKPGETTVAKIGGCFVFNRLCNAESFNIRHHYGEIWECECKEPVEIPKCVAYSDSNSEDFERVWDKKNPAGYVSNIGLPVGTELYRKVTLVRKVK